MWHVYVLQSLADPDRFYVGCTDNIPDRLLRHNAGYGQSQSRHTAKHAPWKILVQIGFEDKAKAYAFEKYLKSGSGRAFARKHF